MIKVVVFDFDGTLLDTETCTYDAFCRIYTEHGQELSLEKWAVGIGTWGAFDPYRDLETLTGGPIDREAVRAAFEADLHERVACAELRPGVLETLEEIRRLGLSTALASSSDRAWIEKHLKAKGIRHYFETIRTKDDVEKVKPDPALYRLTVGALGVKPEEAVAVEDSLNGMRAAKAAGLHAVIVPNPVTRHMDFLAEGADLIVDSLADRPFRDVLEKLKA